MSSCDIRRVVAVALVLTTTFVTMPLTAADFSAVRPVIGSVSAVGAVELRGVGISQEGTLFSGDRIRSNEKAYAKVLLGTGSKIEISAKTDVTFNRDSRGVQLAMNTGMVGFTAHSPVRIDVAPFEVTATDDASGSVTITGSTAGVRAISGKMTVRNLKTSESFTLTKGHEQVLGLTDGIHSPSLGELASNVPEPVPAPKPVPAPQTPAGKTSGGIAMDTGAWLAVIGGAAIGAIAIWALVEAKNNNDDINGLKTQISGLTTNVGTLTTNVGTLTTQIATLTTNQAAGQAALLAQIKAVSNAAAIANAAAQQQAQLATATALAAEAQRQLTGAQLTTANTIAAQIATNTAALATLQTQIAAAQASVAAGGSPAQLTTLLAQEEALRASNNTLGGNLRTLLSNNGIQGGNGIGTVGAPAQTSASVPV